MVVLAPVSADDQLDLFVVPRGVPVPRPVRPGWAAVETVRPGDLLTLPVIGARVVDEVVTYDEGKSWQVVYWSPVEAVFENRARDRSGFGLARRLVLLSTRSWPAGHELLVRRGDETEAILLRKQAREQARMREAQFTQRWEGWR